MTQVAHQIFSPIDFPVLRDMSRVLLFFFLTTCRSQHSLYMRADIISIQPASFPSCRFSQRSPRGISGEPLSTWDLLVPLTPVSLRLTPVTLWIMLQCLQVWIRRHSQTLTGSYHRPTRSGAFENKGNLPENELKVSPVRSYLFEQVWSLSRSGWLLIVKPFSWETHLMELKSFPELTRRRPGL